MEAGKGERERGRSLGVAPPAHVQPMALTTTRAGENFRFCTPVLYFTAHLVLGKYLNILGIRKHHQRVSRAQSRPRHAATARVQPGDN